MTREQVYRERYEEERAEKERKALEARDERIRAEHYALVAWRRNHRETP